MTVAKIYDLNPELVEKNGLIEAMQTILRNNKKTVVLHNTLLALAEIEKVKKEQLIFPTYEIIEKLTTSLPESSDWAQVGILEVLSN